MMSQIEDEGENVDILVRQQLQELHVQRLQDPIYELSKVVWEPMCSRAPVSCAL